MKSEVVENYNGMGAVRFERGLNPQSSKWWVCLSDMVALFPAQTNFHLETWLGSQMGLEQFLEKRGEEVWGIYAIAIELARVPTDSKFEGFPLWIARLGRRI